MAARRPAQLFRLSITQPGPTSIGRLVCLALVSVHRSRIGHRLAQSFDAKMARRQAAVSLIKGPARCDDSLCREETHA